MFGPYRSYRSRSGGVRSKVISYEQLLKTFWESHNPTQGMRQGNDVGTQYRSAIYTFNDAQRKAVDTSKAAYQKALSAKGLGTITTEVAPSGGFYFAEDYHQQYLAKNPAAIADLAAPVCRARSAPASAWLDRLHWMEGRQRPSIFCGPRLLCASWAKNPLLTITGARLRLSRLRGWLRCGLRARFDCRSLPP